MTSMPQKGIDSVTVPGMVDGWAKLHARWGKLPWNELFEPAIFYADHGVTVADMIHDYWAASERGLQENAESRRVFLPEGQVPAVGQVFMNPDLANTLRIVADRGEDAFYKGPIAQAILKTSQENGGTMTADDLAQYSAEWVEPVSTTYRDWTVYELPPNGDGMAALEMLNILEQFQPDPAGPHSPGELHNRIEAMKLAYADVKAYDGDPRVSKIPVAQLTVEGLGRAAGEADRSRPRELLGCAGRADGERHHVSDSGGPRREYRVIHSEQLRRVRFRHHGGWDGVCAAGSRGAL